MTRQLPHLTSALALLGSFAFSACLYDAQQADVEGVQLALNEGQDAGADPGFVPSGDDDEEPECPTPGRPSCPECRAIVLGDGRYFLVLEENMANGLVLAVPERREAVVVLPASQRSADVQFEEADSSSLFLKVRPKVAAASAAPPAVPAQAGKCPVTPLPVRLDEILQPSGAFLPTTTCTIPRGQQGCSVELYFESSSSRGCVYDGSTLLGCDGTAVTVWLKRGANRFTLRAAPDRRTPILDNLTLRPLH